NTVKNYLVRGNGNITDQETLMFIELCKAQHLNPFLNEAYLIKFGTSPANIVVGKDVFVKRANRNEHFEGMRSGIIVERDGNLVEIEGSVKLKKDILIGGWCEVHRNDRKFPIKSSVALEEYSKSQSTWKTMPMVMIKKCAMVTALREAFPEDLQGLYDSCEIKEVPDKLPQKEVVIGKATSEQKRKLLAMAEVKGLYSHEDAKDTSKLEYFCSSNGYDLKDLKFEEVDELLQLLTNYEPAQDVDYTEEPIEETEDNGQIEGQQVMDM
ncbi:MAG: phage recombination protein Bet, partial [Intestinibacter bartlettii]|nr:phage recombination protein Bet [Intestinibacter bartlettii]